MEIVYGRCAGIDVHKKSIKVCVLWPDASGKSQKEIRTFGTMTRNLLDLSDWLVSKGVTHVAMESTGVYWKPVFNILESHIEVLLVNARHIKTVPGRKTDVKDCEWIAQLLQHGLLKGSFVPPLPQRQLRELTRHRTQLISEQTRVANRIQKVLEDANIKLSSVATDILGVSGRDMLQSIIDGREDPKELAQLARKRLRSKIPELELALEGTLNDHHRFMLKMLWDHLMHLEELTSQLDVRIEEKMSPFQYAVQQLETVRGIKRRIAEVIIAEMGPDMSKFPSSGHAASWAGLCPGNNESAGKRKSGTTTKGNRWLRRSLSQAAWAASKTKDSYLSARYKRLARRRGKKRAIVAMSHTILVIAYHLLKEGNAG